MQAAVYPLGAFERRSLFGSLGIREPAHPEQRVAFEELCQCDGTLELSDYEMLADRALEDAGLPVAFPDPRLVAHALRFALCPSACACGVGYFIDGKIYYRPLADARRQGFCIAHELAHGLLGRLGIAYEHVDAQLLTLALLAPSSEVRPLRRRLRDQKCLTELHRRQRHAPPWVFRARMAMLDAGQ